MSDKIITLPYFPGRAEDAYHIKEEISQLEGVVVAVDLPDGLGEEIIKAVEKLPMISVIADEMGRAIPITPNDPAIEAVRSSLDQDISIEFLDASLPFTREEFRGIDKFADLVEDIGVEKYASLLKPYKSQYMESRYKYMALKLKELLEKDEKVLFVCNIKHYKDVLEYLDKPLDMGYGMVVPTITCKVKESDVGKISSEMPFMIFQYENSRNKGFDRGDSILKLYQDEEADLGMVETYKYARNLAISDGHIYPNLYNIIAAAKYTQDDDYAYNVLERSQTYPFTYNQSNCVIKSYINYDLEPLNGASVLEIKKKLKLGSEQSKKRKRDSHGRFFRRFKRTPDCFKKERVFVNYLRNNYFHLVPSGEFEVEEFQCGLSDGIDIRQSLRYRFNDKIFVKNDKMINNTAYVVDFGGAPNTSIFFDSQHNCVGTATNNSQDDGSCWNCMVVFPDTLEVEVSSLLYSVSYHNTRESCVELAAQYSDYVYVFSSSKAEIAENKHNNVKYLPLERIPQNIRDEMRCFKMKWYDSEEY
ncbi:hypothetical protein [uncultured Methanobacterium sp.]|uniref:hypothetical protein n=1 Tax=uncultured Methanobacterium sp. TaxID=176306 RepID=UPI002AA7C73E|nr:hypothetical protein [uncultured Methanobacterium sp.]